jgi:hypothetical protein
MPILAILKTIAKKLGSSGKHGGTTQANCSVSIHHPVNGRYDNSYPQPHQALMLVVAGSVST